MQDILKINLSGVTGVSAPLVDIYINDELFQQDFSVTANTFLGKSDEVMLQGDFSDLESLRIHFKNDAGIERVDIQSITFNDESIDLSQGDMIRENGDTYAGMTKMYWNGDFVLDAQALNAEDNAASPPESTPDPVTDPVTNPGETTQIVEFDLTSVRGSEGVNIYVNGEMVEHNHTVSARLVAGQQETLRVEVDAASVDTVSVEFFNDAGSSRVDVLDVRVNGNALNLDAGTLTRTNGDTYDGQTKMYWNGELEFDVPADYSNIGDTPAEPTEPEIPQEPEEPTEPEQPEEPDTEEPEAPTDGESTTTQNVEIDLTAVQGVETVDIFINGELVESNYTVTSRLTRGQQETLELEVNGEDVDDIRIAFTNDSGSSRVDVLGVRVNGHTLDLDSSEFTRANGSTYDGQTKMYWNGELSIDVPQAYNNDGQVIDEPDVEQPPIEPEDPTPEPEVPEPDVEEPTPDTETVIQQVDIAMTSVSGNEAVNVYINGELVEQNHIVRALMSARQSETVSLEATGVVESVEVEFVNDSGSSRVDILGVRVNNNELDIEDSTLTRLNGDVHEGLTKMYWNGEFSVNVPGEYNNMTADQPTDGSPEEPTPEEPTPETPPTDGGNGDNTPDPSPPTGDADWGGVDPNMYRGDYEGRDRAVRVDDNSGETLYIQTGTSARQISALIEKANPNTHLTVEFAQGEHWFTEKLLVERGDITITGAGEGKTVFVANFPDGKVDNLIQIQGDDIRLDSGSNNGRWRADQSDYVGNATKAFSLGDDQLSVSSTRGLSIGDHVMVYKEGTASKHDDDDEFGTIAEISGISGNTLTFKHSLAFGSDLLAKGESLNDVKVYELDLLENVNVHDFSVRYNITDADLYNPYNMPVEDILDTTEFNFYPKYAASGKALGEASYGSHRAVVLSGTHEANIYDVTLEDVGSHAFFFSGNLELYADNLTVDGTYNKGVDGNGYGIEFDKTYYSDFTNLDITNVRHSVSANMLGGNGYNNFHVSFTDSNMDFHGGRDQANLYYIETMDYESEWLPKIVNGKLSGDINYSGGKFQFELIDYRQEENASENTVIWKNVKANNSADNDGGVYNENGEKMAAYLRSNDDLLVASDNGANINAGYGNDLLVSGKGNDIFTGGKTVGNAGHTDTFVFNKDSGQDVITDFESAHDRILVASDVHNSIWELLNSTTQSGNDVILDFGNGNNLTLQNTSVDELNSGNISLADDISDFGM